jgi:hypothetical protein
MNFIKTNFISLIVILLLVIIILVRGCSPTTIEKPKVVTKIVYIKHDSLIYSKPLMVYSKPIETPGDIKYIPDTNYNELKKQYQDLLVVYFTKNVQKDRLKIDSIGFVDVTDTVFNNEIQNRFYKYSIQHPVITTTITLPSPARNQIYIGGSLEGNTTNVINQINAGLLLKNKRDQIYGVYTGLNKDGKITYGFQAYWKIKLRK